MNIAGYVFEGPWILGQVFNEVPGVYAVYTNARWLDVGQTDRLGNRINGDNHDRKQDWIRNADQKQIFIAFLREPVLENRLQIESNLRLILRPICGDR